MGVYTVMLPDEIIIKAIEDFTNIVVIGCAGCANESLAYDKDQPQKAVFDKFFGQYMPAPDAITQEASRLANIFKNKGKDARIAISMVPCSYSNNGRPAKWKSICSDAEAVVTLCCVAGTVGIKTHLEKSVNIIPGMKTVGVHYCHKIYDSAKGMIYIDKNNSKFISIFKP
ncbi:MAG: hypothetical protein JW967_10445 [Dehalococcoidales bacterium]|nr:hypothetical protein [Dehalococcoidales bacterium]